MSNIWYTDVNHDEEGLENPTLANGPKTPEVFATPQTEMRVTRSASRNGTPVNTGTIGYRWTEISGKFRTKV